jgi:hypothetical protein
MRRLSSIFLIRQPLARSSQPTTCMHPYLGTVCQWVLPHSQRPTSLEECCRHVSAHCQKKIHLLVHPELMHCFMQQECWCSMSECEVAYWTCC